MEQTNERIAMRVSWNTILVNVLLSVFKLFAGVFAHSAAMVSDAVHSASDVLSTIIVMVGIKLAGRESDRGHPYGHERLECVAALLLACILFATGAGIGFGGIQKIAAGNYGALTVPGALALIAAAVSIVVKEGMYWYTRAAAKKVGSGALMASAWHHRSDALSSVGSFAGILGARMGFPVLDAVASVVISVFIIKAAYDIFMDSAGKMTDQACDDTTVEKLRAVVLEHDGVLCIDQIKTRLFGNRVYVDIEISADGEASLHDAHETAQKVHDDIEARFPQVKHCMVHVNPMERPDGTDVM